MKIDEKLCGKPIGENGENGERYAASRSEKILFPETILFRSLSGETVPEFPVLPDEGLVAACFRAHPIRRLMPLPSAGASMRPFKGRVAGGWIVGRCCAQSRWRARPMTS